MSPREDSSLLSSGKSSFPSNNNKNNNVIVDLERRNRRRKCITLTSCCVILVLVGMIAVWSSWLRPRNSSDLADKSASDALRALNKNLRSQIVDVKARCESTVLIMRHCEKYGLYVEDEDGSSHCSYLGFERAKYVSTLFGSNKHERWPSPAHLFVLSPDRNGHWNFREWETLHPTAQKLGITIDVVGRQGPASDVFDLLKSGTLCGQLIVISWKHELIPDLANSLGCGLKNGCPHNYPQSSFDEVWQLKYVFHPFSKPKNQTLHRGLDEVSKMPKHGWNLYASVTNLDFDALSFSKAVGDYPPGGIASGGRWDEEM